MSRVQVLLLIVLCSTAAAKFNTQLDATHKGELIAKINAFVATPNEKSVKIDVSNSKFGRLRDLSESCYAMLDSLLCLQALKQPRAWSFSLGPTRRTGTGPQSAPRQSPSLG